MSYIEKFKNLLNRLNSIGKIENKCENVQLLLGKLLVNQINY
ncbi:MAG: hypothetical protein QW303_03655 [Nitrososphaerota archaeon]